MAFNTAIQSLTYNNPKEFFSFSILSQKTRGFSKVGINTFYQQQQQQQQQQQWR
jgi:hypothetical protein